MFKLFLNVQFNREEYCCVVSVWFSWVKICVGLFTWGRVT